MRTGIKVADAMTTKPVTANSGDSIRDCARTMKKFDVGSVMIREGESIKGIVTEYDFVRKVVAEGRDEDDPVDNIMETALVTVEPGMDLFEAIEIMKDNEIRHLPVVEDGKFLGLITMKDILKIEPQLFDLLVEKIRLREESRKPISEITTGEGVCESCGNYTEKLYESEGIRVCSNCYSE